MTTEDTNTPKPHLVDYLLEILGSPGITETTYWKMRAAISSYLAEHIWQEQQAKIAAREPLLAHEVDLIEREDSSLLRQTNKEIIASRGQVSTVCFYCGATVTRGTDYPADAEDACYLGNDPGGLEPYVTDPDGYVRHASFVEECRPRDLRYTLPVGIPTESEVIDASPESYTAPDASNNICQMLYNIAVCAEDVAKLWFSPIGNVTGQEDPNFGAPMTHLRQHLNLLYQEADIVVVADLRERLK